MSVLVVGSVALDTIRTHDGAEYAGVLGGSCTYFACAASYFAPVRVVAVVGEDFEQRHIDLLRRHDVDLAGLEIKQGGKTFRWAGTYSADMNDRTTDDLQFGVLAEFDPVLPETYRQTPFVFLACAQPELQLKVIDQMQGRPFVVSDTIEFYIENNRDALMEVFQRSAGVIVNDSEARLLTGETNLIRATDKLLTMGPQFVLVKKGEHGCLLATEKELFPLPAFPLRELVDPTGAGDTFAAGFMGSLAAANRTDTDALRRAVVAGTVMASFTCGGISLSRLEQLTPEEIRARTDHLEALLRIPE